MFFREQSIFSAPRVLCVILSVFLSGLASCSTTPQTLSTGAAVPADFVSQGKLSLRPQGETKASGKVTGFSANYRWQQVGADYNLELWGALGQGRTRITGNANRIKIVDGSGRVVRSRNPQRLLKRHLGWSLPLAVLPYWLQGEGAPTPPAKMMRFQANSDLESMEQLGWTLTFDRYRTVIGRSRQDRLPGRVRASSPELKLTVVSREWALDT